MGAGADKEVDLFGAVVNRMKSPQERDLVTEAVRPVIAELPHDKRRDRANPHRLGGDR